MQNATKGVFITTSRFSAGAINTVKHTSKKIVLIDGKKLADYMIEYNVGVSEKKSWVLFCLSIDSHFPLILG